MEDYEKNKMLKKAKEELEDFAGGDAAYWAEDAYLRARADRAAEIDTAHDEGVEEGLEKGAKAKQIEIAKKMLKQKIDIDNIVICTGLTKEEVINLI